MEVMRPVFHDKYLFTMRKKLAKQAPLYDHAYTPDRHIKFRLGDALSRKAGAQQKPVAQNMISWDAWSAQGNRYFYLYPQPQKSIRRPATAAAHKATKLTRFIDRPLPHGPVGLGFGRVSEMENVKRVWCSVKLGTGQ